jgi:hypothetical protein
MDMEKKVDLLIKGNLLVTNNITGGGGFLVPHLNS